MGLMALLIVIMVEEYFLVSWSYLNLMEQGEWGLVHSDREHHSIVLTQRCLSLSLDILAEWWLSDKKWSYQETQKIGRAQTSLVWDSCRTCECVTQYTYWCGWYSMQSPKVTLHFYFYLSSSSVLRCPLSNVYSQDKSVKPGFELQASQLMCPTYLKISQIKPHIASAVVQSDIDLYNCSISLPCNPLSLCQTNGL